MNPTQTVPRLAMAVVAIVTAAAVGCASGGFKVPAAEVQRLAQLPAAERGRQVRVVPWDSDAPPAPAAIATSQNGEPASQPMEMDPIWNGDVYVDLSVPAGHVAPARGTSWRGPGLTAGTPHRIASAGTFRGAPDTPPAVAGRGSQGGWRGSPPPSSSSPSPSPARFNSPSLPSRRGSSSGRKGGGGGGDAGEAMAAIVAVVLVVGLIVVIASAVADAEKETASARSFDGWVNVDANQLIHLHYNSGVEREIPLSGLTPADAVGVRYGYLREIDGPVVPLQQPWAFRDAPPPPKPPPVPPLLSEEPDG